MMQLTLGMNAWLEEQGPELRAAILTGYDLAVQDIPEVTVTEIPDVHLHSCVSIGEDSKVFKFLKHITEAS